MESPAMKKVRITPEFKQDRISALPDELIHEVLSFLDAKVAVQTSVLSKRWKLTWTTLPYLNIGKYEHSSFQNTRKFIHHVLSNRNHESNIFKLKLCIHKYKAPNSLDERFLQYAFSHNVKKLSFEPLYNKPYKLSAFSSNSLEALTLRVKFEDSASKSDCWLLPALRYLHLIDPTNLERLSLFRDLNKLPESCLTCLPALRTLWLDNWNLSISSFSFSLPDLKTLGLYRCSRLPQIVWNFPALLSLELHAVDFPQNMSDIFPTLVNLQNLKLYLTRRSMEQHHSISCPQLLTLYIRIRFSDSLYGGIKVLAPKLRNFTSLGILLITFVVPELETANIKLCGWFGDMDWIYRKKYYQLFTDMLSGLGNAKNLTFDLDGIEALSATHFLASLPCPFYNLKIVKLPLGCKESSISSALRSYLLGGSSRASIVTTFSQSNMTTQTVPVSMTNQNAVLQEPLAALTRKLDGSQYMHQTPNVSTVNMNLQEESVVEDSVVDAVRVTQIGAPGEEIVKERVSSSVGNRDFGLWRGHAVNPEFVCLLDLIMHNYPETFEHFTTKNKKLCTINLNMLCTSLCDFTKTSMTEVDSEIIVGFRHIFAYLQNQGFNVSWALSRLNYIEHLRFSKPLILELQNIDCRIHDDKRKLQELQTRVDDVNIELQDLQAHVDDARTKLQAVQTLRLEKLAEIEKAFGTLGTNLVVGFIGDDLYCP